MFYRQEKEYYPLEIRQIIGRNEKVVYDRDRRDKSYVYIALENRTENS